MTRLKITVEGKVYDVTIEPLESDAHVQSSSVDASLAHSCQDNLPSKEHSGSGVQSPLAGKVVSIDIKQGQGVAEGEQLMVLEAMKMNTYIYAPRAGTVGKILTSEGDSVEEGQELIQIV